MPSESRDQSHQNTHHGHGGLDYRRIADRWDSLPDLFQALLDQLRVPTVVLGEKGVQARLAGFLQCLQCGPPFQ
jgi:hypothetical protein